MAGSTAFVQGHFVLGHVVGEAARAAVEEAMGPVLVGLAALAVVGLVVWARRRRRPGGVPR